MTQEPLYKDLDLRMKPHPLTGDLVTLTNDAAVKQSLRNLFHSQYFDFPMDGKKYAGLKRYLFDNGGQLTESKMRNRLEWLIKKGEPRVKVEKIDIKFEEQGKEVRITVYYTILSIMVQESFEFTVQRVR